VSVKPCQTRITLATSQIALAGANIGTQGMGRMGRGQEFIIEVPPADDHGFIITNTGARKLTARYVKPKVAQP
jgi:hypothetical protein